MRTSWYTLFEQNAQAGNDLSNLPPTPHPLPTHPPSCTAGRCHYYYREQSEAPLVRDEPSHFYVAKNETAERWPSCYNITIFITHSWCVIMYSLFCATFTGYQHAQELTRFQPCTSTLSLTHLLSISLSGELRTQKLKSPLVRTQSLNVIPFKPEVGQYIAIHATLTARDFFLAYFYTSSPFTCIFSKTSSNFFLCWPAE